jgi:hypothetical protein
MFCALPTLYSLRAACTCSDSSLNLFRSWHSIADCNKRLELKV